MLKAELEKKLAEAQERIEFLKDKNENLDVTPRRDFSKILGKYIESDDRFYGVSASSMMPFSSEEDVLSWSEIYSEIGRLLADRDVADLQESVKRIKKDIEFINMKLDKKDKIDREEQQYKCCL